MGTDSVSRLNNSAMSLASLQDSRLSTVNFLLSNRNLDDLITDRNRVLKAIDLAINARLNLDPYFDPKELSDVKRDYLADRIMAKIASKEIIKAVKPDCSISIPKNFFQTRHAEYFDLEDYSIRFLLALVLSERFSFLDSVYGGKLEIFQIDNGDSYRLKRRHFHKLQNALLLSESFPWLVYVDISNYYSTIKKNNLIEIIKTKLSLSDENYFLKLVEKYFEKISIGSWCDNFIQNIYLSNLDLSMNSSEWNYMRMNDDIRVYCNSLQVAEMAYYKIETELKKLDLEINKAKQFVIEPMINKSTAKWTFYGTRCYNYTNGKTSPIIELRRVAEYPVENVYILTSDSDRQECVQILYNSNFQKNISYRDEILNKIGFDVEGVDIRDVLENFENRESLSSMELSILSEIFFYTNTSYQFTIRLVRLFVSKSFASLHDEGVIELIKSVFKRLTSDWSYPNYTNYGRYPTYLDYVFLRVVFFESAEFCSDLKHIRNVIIDWFERLVFYSEGYVQKAVRHIINSGLFRVVDSHYSETLFDENFWLKIIDREFSLKGISDNGFVSEYSNQVIQALSDNFVHYKKKLNSIELINSDFNNSYKINVWRANLSYLRGDYKNVMDVLLMHNLKDLNGENLILLAISYSKLGDIEKAKSVYTKLISLESNATALNNRGLILIKESRLDEAILDFSGAICLCESSRYYENRAYCFMHTGQFAEALKDIDRAIEIDRQRVLEVNHSYRHVLRDFDYLPEFFARYINMPNMDRLSELAYLKRAVINKSLGNMTQAHIDVEIYCKLHKNNSPSEITRLTNELLEGKLRFWQF
jgi:tetratricopeptide (TPR) repeat protein